jgi:hypothetical protein
MKGAISENAAAALAVTTRFLGEWIGTSLLAFLMIAIPYGIHLENQQLSSPDPLTFSLIVLVAAIIGLGRTIINREEAAIT